MPFHLRTQRFATIVAHRRAGKTVAAVNDTIKRACERPGAYALIGPFRSQMKSVAWEYVKHYAQPVTVGSNEAELTVKLRNSSTIRLFGADNADAIRGHGFLGVYMDEYGDFRPSVWGNIIRPTLSDHEGWAVFGGTPKGHNQFYDAFKASEDSQGWFSAKIRASESGILSPGELAAVREQLSEDQYLQEYECSFEAAIRGAYYGTEMRQLTDAGRICEVSPQIEVPVHTAWDLGYTDDTAIWFYQVVRGEVHVVDYWAGSGASVDDVAAVVTGKPYGYGLHWLPHDARAKTLASGGKSVIEQLARHLGMGNLRIVPNLAVQDGIQAARKMLGRTWFDRGRCMDGVEALRQYSRAWDEDKKAFAERPLHNWASHSADAFRMLAIAERAEEPKKQPEKPKFAVELTLDEMWSYTEAQNERYRRI